MSVCQCSGWWVQSGWGRQPMNDLMIKVEEGAIEGTGRDIIARFELKGSLRADGTVEILKLYENRHSVLYVGQFDGEGSFHGDWAIDQHRGTWHIKLGNPLTPPQIQDL